MPSLFVDAMAASETTAVDFVGVDACVQMSTDELDAVTAEMSKFNCFASTNSTCSSSDAGYPDTILDPYILALQQQQMAHLADGLAHCGRVSLNTTECVPVPSSEHVAEIVGRQGCKIKALRAKTNTYIKTPVRGEESVFIVTGRKADVEAAKLEIFSAADHFTQIRASRRHSQGGIPAPGHITAYVRVPYKFVGLVVGPKGATIKRIQQMTHTYIITPSREKEPIFEVTGLSENVEAARHEIELHIVSRTGVLLQALDDLNLMNKINNQADPSMISMDDFHLNGTDIAYGDEQARKMSAAADCSCESLLSATVDRPSFVPQTTAASNNVIRKPLALCQNNNNLVQRNVSVTCACKNNFLCASSLVQDKYGKAWSTGLNSSVNLSGSDQEDGGVWSMGGDSPSNNPMEPLFPSYLSSIWSDF